MHRRRASGASGTSGASGAIGAGGSSGVSGASKIARLPFPSSGLAETGNQDCQDFKFDKIAGNLDPHPPANQDCKISQMAAPSKIT